MEDLYGIYKKARSLNEEMAEMHKDFILKLRAQLRGTTALTPSTQANVNDIIALSPQQTKKRPKRLTSLKEDEEDGKQNVTNSINKVKPTSVKDTTLAEKCDSGMPAEDNTNNNFEENHEKSIMPPVATLSNESLMPPPPAPVDKTFSSESHETTYTRPQRAAKLKSAKNLKEPKINVKLRRPTEESSIVKIESEQRQSQIHTAVNRDSVRSESRSETSVLMIAEKQSVVELSSDDEREQQIKPVEQKTANSKKSESDGTRQFCIKIKREKMSTTGKEAIHSVLSTETILPETQDRIVKAEPIDQSLASSTASLTSNPSGLKKKGRKKKQPHKPIKVERFSDADGRESPIALRTRKHSDQQQMQQREKGSDGSIYEDAIDKPVTEPTMDVPIHSVLVSEQRAGPILNETVTISKGNKLNETVTLDTVKSGMAISTNPNATVTLAPQACDATFNVATKEPESKQSLSTTMATAKDHDSNDNVMTDDESFESPASVVLPTPKKPPPSTIPLSVKSHKLPSHTNELFNPFIQSPVKMKVKAFENAQTASMDPKRTLRSRNAKENEISNGNSKNSGSGTYTPVIGKLQAPVLGRFLTPTQLVNIPSSASNAQAKKGPNSASKAMAFPKFATNLKSTVSCSSATSSRENIVEDLRKGIDQITEERKRQREQKHLMAAQQREAKERERAERILKLQKEREEKRLRKQMEAAQKKKELEEIQRKRQEEIIAKQTAAKNKMIMEKEKELLMKQQQLINAKGRMMPPADPKVQRSYSFTMLHQDDSTDDEGKTTYKRPPPPTWSQTKYRGPAIVMQQHCPTEIIDSFFSVQPTTPDLKIIFPGIDARHLRRNSSVLWSTPPRYSELPKY